MPYSLLNEELSLQMKKGKESRDKPGRKHDKYRRQRDTDVLSRSKGIKGRVRGFFVFFFRIRMRMRVCVIPNSEKI